MAGGALSGIFPRSNEESSQGLTAPLLSSPPPPAPLPPPPPALLTIAAPPLPGTAGGCTCCGGAEGAWPVACGGVGACTPM